MDKIFLADSVPLWLLSYAVHSCLSYLLPCFSICACVILLIITHFNAFRMVLIYDTLYALANYLHISIDAVFSDKKSNMDSTMQQIIAELNSCPEEQKQLALSTLRGLLDGFKNLS